MSDEVLIVGAGIGGLTLALELARRGIACRVFESAPEIKAVGVGINILPHAMQVFADHGLIPALQKVAVETAEAAFFNRFGQLIYREPLGKRAGYAWPQLSIHRGDLQTILLKVVKAKLGADRVHLGFHCTGFEQGERSVQAKFRDQGTIEGIALVACDGIHSVVRQQLYPKEGEPRYSGINMWRGVTRWKPILGGATMTRAGWLKIGKLVHYPIRNDIDAEGRQLVNWLWEIETPQYKRWDWNRAARIEDFIAGAEDWRFDWLDVPAFFRAADVVLEYPMVDKDPLPAWSFGRVTLLGDAAHPMYPRGSNGAGQAILDARQLAESLVEETDVQKALKRYEAKRLAPTANVVLENRRNPPDAILREVYERSGDRPFESIDAVMSQKELKALSDRYKQVAGYDKRTLEESKP
ncbi:MAG: 5-methylphenazine-carboxylate 1-monooxygenase [Betaproteobacteria bacterium]|nr:5-methylphenazine-carboxylate 1-monooxygenase [Betaproteobacteria bacterium]